MNAEISNRVRRVVRLVVRFLGRTALALQAVREKEGNLKSILIEEASRRRGLEIRRADRRLVFVRINGSFLPFEQMTGPSAGSVARYLCAHKQHAHIFLAGAGIDVAKGRVVGAGDYAAAACAARELGYPVVVKPTSAARGRGVQTNVRTLRELRRAVRRASVWGTQLIVEQQIQGDDFRFFVVDGKVVSVTHRVRAFVQGDGRSTVRELIERKNEERRRNRYLQGSLIPTRLRHLSRLKRSGRDLGYVPAHGEIVTLRDQSNLSAGGDSIDVTDTCHPGFKALAVRAIAAIPGLPYGGVDMLVQDITVEPVPGNHVVSEVEFFPGPVAQFPITGVPRDMAGAVLEYYLERYRGSDD